ncbi:MAG: hypothetical protein HYR84_10680 [Planctomycetes bacterium]|nr:hypothetical protein [Planctomycetota bacterium]
MTRQFVVIHEARADFRTATEIADRVLLAEINWLDDAIIETQRTWLPELLAGIRMTWSSLPGHARQLGIRVHGHFDGEPGAADAHAARRAIAYVLRVLENVDAIVLIRDVDKQIERKKGLNQARTTFSSRCKIVIGLANRKREAWVIGGFDPENDSEAQSLAAETQKLGHDPRTHSHELTASEEGALRCPKRVLMALSRCDWNRERKCWQSTPLDLLRERGARNGLAEFLDEIKTHIVPLISGHEK